MWKLLVITVLGVCLIACPNVSAAEPPIATVTRIEVGERPLIDGKLTDACWQKGA